MKYPRIVLSAAVALVSGNLVAGELHIPMAFEFLAVDGQKVKRSIVLRTSELELGTGTREIALRYSDMVDSDLHDAQDSVKSDAFIVTLNVEQGVDYYLEPSGGVIRKPLEYAEAPQVEISRKDGGRVEYKLTHTDISQKEFDTLLYSANQTGVYAAPSEPQPEAFQWAADASSAAPAAPAAAAPVAAAAVVEEDITPEPAAPVAPVAAPAAKEAGADAAEMLQLWWQRADEQTRKEFLSWAVKQL